MQSSSEGYGGVSELQLICENCPFIASSLSSAPSDLNCVQSPCMNFQSPSFTRQPDQFFYTHDSHQQQPLDMNFDLDIKTCDISRNVVSEEVKDDGLHIDLLQNWQQRQDEAVVIKEPSRRHLGLDYCFNSNMRCKDYLHDQIDTPNSKLCNNITETIVSDDYGHIVTKNYKAFDELEAIYKPKIDSSVSGSGPSGHEFSLMPVISPPVVLSVVGDGATDALAIDETLNKKSVKKLLKVNGRRKRKRGVQEQFMNSVATFFQRLIKQTITHHEALHVKFMEVMEKRDQERAKRESVCSKKASVSFVHEATALNQDSQFVASYDTATLSFLEQIVGKNSMLLSTGIADPSQHNDVNSNEHYMDEWKLSNNSNKLTLLMNKNRWLKEEIEALIRIRSQMEWKFQGRRQLKATLWDEVSAEMEAIGYYQNAKRCKEKWDNVNKYFKKAIENGKKRSQSSKTCPYFQQLEDLYSKSFNMSPNISATSNIVSISSDDNADDQCNRDQKQLNQNASNENSVPRLTEFDDKGDENNNCKSNCYADDEGDDNDDVADTSKQDHEG